MTPLLRPGSVLPIQPRSFMRNRLAIVICLILFCYGLASAQAAKPAKANQREGAKNTLPPAEQALAHSATYSYEFKQPAFFISRVFIETNGEGRGNVTFERKDADETLTDPFSFSSAAWARVRDLWEQLNFLESSESYQSERQYPHLGTMWLRMKEGERERTAEFNWTRNKIAEALINEYRRAAEQAQFVFEITLARENQPLGTPKIMETLENTYKRQGLSDPHQLAPFLRELSTDERLPLMARNRAAKVLAAIEKK